MKKIALFCAVLCTGFTTMASCGGNKSTENAEKPEETVTEVVEQEEPARRLKITDIHDGAKALGNQAGNTYHAVNMFDDDPSTGWAIKLSKTQGESDKIYGPSMNLNAKKVDYIIIRNGYGKSRDSFYKNTRAKWIEIYREGDFEFPEEEDILYSGPLKDTMEPQKLKINPEYDNSRPTGQVQLRFKAYIPGYDNDGYYMGSKWDDLVISELEFFGTPLKK